MPLPSFLKRAAPDGEAPGVVKAESAALVQARRRLIGAAVLLAVGVVIFPLLFESKPRPLPTDLPMQYAPTALRGAEGAPLAPAASSGRVAPAAATAGKTPSGATPTASDAVPAPGSAPGPLAGAPSTASGAATGDASPATAESAVDEAAPPAPSTPPPAAAAQGTAAAGSATADPPSKAGGVKPPPGSPPAGKDAVATRYIVQVGAFADATAAREVRQKVERLGFTTYTHVIDVPGGQRIRVRVGPMTDRAEAQRTLDKIKQAGLPAALLTL